jgi:hypothetical protein
MTESTDGTLLYRATRDGFEASSFHEKCDDKDNTITIIKTNENYVFGGYTAAEWTSDGDVYTEDTNSFIFSVRRKGISSRHKFMVKTEKHVKTINGNYGPIFGFVDMYIVIIDKSNINIGSNSNLGRSYNFPLENGDRTSFFAGSYNNWLTTEIEVYQINN